MAAAPEWKVYDKHGNYQAACKEIEAAASLMGFYGKGATIRHGHGTTVWTQLVDGDAMASYDYVVAIVTNRMRGVHERSYIRQYGKLPS